MLKKVAVLLVCFIWFGCDKFYGLAFRNEYPEDIVFIFHDKDGKIKSGSLPPCGVMGSGPLDPERGMPGTLKVVVKWKGEIIREFSEEELRKMLEKENSGGSYAGWDIGPSGVHFSEERVCSLEKKKE